MASVYRRRNWESVPWETANLKGRSLIERYRRVTFNVDTAEGPSTMVFASPMNRRARPSSSSVPMDDQTERSGRPQKCSTASKTEDPNTAAKEVIGSRL